ncbi:hypothetical protein [Actinomadura rubrisoli]|uniref:Crocagin biosynthetic protein CgnE/B domain-containing protein n=1 Tax=Actinomadura rubrisoli TaxID=2530368 RepID=A0A4R4ZZ85_9ACTN|nr:hypothetical protein [Actinomadura rubrisoli]TDD63706.1 hypothetical protein E1298_43360 [Actinomadura rubrisoli]
MTAADMIPDDAVWDGVSTLLDQYLRIQTDDQVFLLYTADAREPAAWVAAELAVRGIEPTPLGMSAVRDDTVESRLRAVLPDPASPHPRIVVLTMELNSMSHVLQLRRALAPYPEDSWATYRIINASAEFFRHSMGVTPALLSALNGALLTRMMPASHLRITSSSGTDLEVAVDSRRYRWLSNRGVWRPGAFLVLPPGEVSTYPADINGVLVADGAFNVTSYTGHDARLGGHPVTVDIEHGRVTGVACADPLVARLLERCLRVENADRIGELGFGTNVGTTGFIPLNSHINERHPGVHLGLGMHGQRLDVVDYWSDIHLDLITSDATIAVDGRTEIRSTDLRDFADERHPAPLTEGLHEEDIDGDCCGLITSEVARAKNEFLRLRGQRC